MPTLIASANFTDGNVIPQNNGSGAIWSPGSTGWGGATLAVDTAGGNNSIRGICPATNGESSGVILGLDFPSLGLSSIYIKFRAKHRGRPHAIKYCKVHGKRASDYPEGTVEIPLPQQYANCTFGLTVGGAMLQTSYGDGSTPGNDTANVIDLTGASHQLGRSAGIATVSTPQNSGFLEAMWGEDTWHTFKVHVKFNSGTSALNEVADGEFYVEIDGNVYVNATGLFNRHFANMPIERISFFDVAQDNDYGYELLYDDIEVSTGGFMDSSPDPDTIINAISFPPSTNCAPGSSQSSSVRTITGINTATPITAATNCTYSINGAAATFANGSISNTQTIQLFTTASNIAGASVNASVTIGGQVFIWTISTIQNVSTQVIKVSGSYTLINPKKRALKMKTPHANGITQTTAEENRTLLISLSELELCKFDIGVEKNSSATGVVEIWAHEVTATRFALIGSVNLGGITDKDYTIIEGAYDKFKAVPVGVTGSFNFSCVAW